MESYVTGYSEISRKTDADPSLRIRMTSAFFDRGRITAYSPPIRQGEDSA
jgi:hypothetical protein